MYARIGIVGLTIAVAACGNQDAGVEPRPGGSVEVAARLLPPQGSASDPEIGGALLVVNGPVFGVESAVARVLTFEEGGRTWVSLIVEDARLLIPFTLVLAGDEAVPDIEIVEVVDPANDTYFDLDFTVEVN